MLIVVNMFLTGFDATTLNTLGVDKSLRPHGLLQAFSRTNRILNSVRTYGNIVSEESLRPDETRDFVQRAFRDGAIPVAGTAITKILPPVSRFAADNTHALKKQTVLGKLRDFFDRYSGLV